MAKLLTGFYIIIAFFTTLHNNAYSNKCMHKNTGTITLQFDNIAGIKDLVLDSGNYINAAGEQFTISFLQYFISNIKFTSVDGRQYIVPQGSCYFLINEADSASQFCTMHIPEGEYKSLSFIVGIDSLRNTMSIEKRTGILDPANSDMYWQWNSGYIFFKAEGICSSAPVDPLGLHKYRYHIGGFGGYNAATLNNIKTVTLNALNPVQITSNKNTSLHILADVLKIFNGATNISIAKHSTVMFDKFSTTVANNYAGMFSLENN